MVLKKKTSIFVLILILVLPFKHVLAAPTKEFKKETFCYLCKYKKSDGLMYVKEKQFYRKVELLKSTYGNSIDEIALAASVLHRYGTDEAYNKVYESDFNEDSYKARAKGFSKLLTSSSDDTSSLSEDESKAVQENEKIDLLTLAAIVMADSNHHGVYSDVCFRDALAGNRLVGNDESSIFGSLLNAITCKKEAKGTSSYEGDSSIVAAESNKLRLKNLKKVCENGFVGGLYNGISDLTDEKQKEAKKKVYAQQIIDLANYYKKLYSKDDSSCNINIAGATGDFANWKQADPAWGSVNMGGTPNVARYGCMITSIAMQIARSGTQIGQLPSGYTEFNPGAFATSLSSHGGFAADSANFTGTGFQTIAPNWRMIDMVEVSYADDSRLADMIAKELSEPYDGKYQKFIILRIQATGHPQHWVAVNGVENGHVTVFDPGSSGVGNTLSEGYSNLVINGYKVMYATDVMFGQTGTSARSTCTSSYGTGAIQIPSPYGAGGYTVTEIDVWNWLYDCRKVYDEWIAKGAKHDNGLATIDGRYLIACTSTFGKVGDKIDFFLEDGTRIPAIMFDTKNPHDANYNQWGHSDGGNVIEFEVLSSYYHRYGNPGSSEWFPQWAGKRVSSATNLGGGGSSQVSSSSNQVSNNVCETKRDGDLIAKLAVAVAPTAAPDSRISVDHYKTKSDDSRAKAYNDIFYQTIAKYPSDGGGNPNARGDGYNNPAYASCAQAAAAIIRATVDPDISSGNPTSMEQYLKNNPEKWIKAGELKAGEKFTDKCKPGDLLLTVDNSGDSGHAMIYVGKYAKNNFPNTNGVVWEAANDMSGRYLYPGITDKKSWSSTMAIWRPTGKGSFYYPFIDISKYVDIDVSCKKNNSSGQVCINGQAVDGNNGVGSTNMNYSNAVEIPDYLWKNHVRWDTDPSIVVVDDSGNVLAQRKPNVRREGASTTKVFSGYAALKLLDVNNDVVTTTQFICSNTDNSKGVAVGTKTSVVDAATRDFPGSDNARADSIPLAIGYKYYSGSSDKDAYTVGLEKMNNLYRQIGCTNTNIGSGSGVISFNDSGWRSQDIYGIQTYSDGTGHTANDLALVTIEAMKDENFAGHFSNRNNEGLFYIKSGTGHCGHGIWGFNHNGKRYYISILGMNCNWSQGSHDVKHTSKERTVKDIYNWVITDLIK